MNNLPRNIPAHAWSHVNKNATKGNNGVTIYKSRHLGNKETLYKRYILCIITPVVPSQQLETALSLLTHFVPYVHHTQVEETNDLERALANDEERLAACQETILARKRWDQFVDAGIALTGKMVKVSIEGYWVVINVARVDRTQNCATECFVLVSDNGARHHITPHTKLMMQNPNF